MKRSHMEVCAYEIKIGDCIKIRGQQRRVIEIESLTMDENYPCLKFTITPYDAIWATGSIKIQADKKVEVFRLLRPEDIQPMADDDVKYAWQYLNTPKQTAGDRRRIAARFGLSWAELLLHFKRLDLVMESPTKQKLREYAEQVHQRKQARAENAKIIYEAMQQGHRVETFAKQLGVCTAAVYNLLKTHGYKIDKKLTDEQILELHKQFREKCTSVETKDRFLLELGITWQTLRLKFKRLKLSTKMKIPKRIRTQASEEKAKAIYESMKNGEKAIAIAQRLGITKGAVRQWLRRYGYKMRETPKHTDPASSVESGVKETEPR